MWLEVPCTAFLNGAPCSRSCATDDDAFHRQSGRDWNFQIVARPFRTASMCRDGADHGEPEVRTIQLSRSIDACRGRAPTSQRSMLKSELLLARAVGRIAA